jgi:hypothetical protein
MLKVLKVWAWWLGLVAAGLAMRAFALLLCGPMRLVTALMDARDWAEVGWLLAMAERDLAARRRQGLGPEPRPGMRRPVLRVLDGGKKGGAA